MDPNQTLRDLRHAVEALRKNDGISDYDCSGDVDTFVEAFEVLDAWLKNGGFKPHDWE